MVEGELPSYTSLPGAQSDGYLKRARDSILVLDKGWKKILFGQTLSISLACCSAASAELVKMPGVKNMPLFQISGGYFFLSLCLLFLDNSKSRDKTDVHCGEESRKLLGTCQDDTQTLQIHAPIPSQNEDKKLSVYRVPLTSLYTLSPWYKYAMLAFLDVQANLFIVLSFRFTTITSTTLLSSLSVLSAMVASSYIMKRKFQTNNKLGAILCIIGASMVVLSDASAGKSPSSDTFIIGSESGSDDDNIGVNVKMLGDGLAIISSFIFGFDDTLSEYFIKHSNTNEYLGMLGLLGFFFSIGESIIFERDQVSNLFIEMYSNHTFESQALKMWVWYMATLVYFYVAASFFLKTADSTLLSLSLLSSNMWITILSIVLQGIYPPLPFYYAVVFMGSGVWLYERGAYYFEEMKPNATSQVR